MASIWITYLNIDIDRQYDYDGSQSELTYILIYIVAGMSPCLRCRQF